jgi:pimeloyl-ACP methyl ester carboxylesterase
MLKKIFAVVTALIVLVLFGAAWHFSSQLIGPRPYVCKQDHFIYCEGASKIGLPFEEVSFKNSDNLNLRGWFFPRHGSDRAVVMVHGITADRREGLRWVKALHAGGYNLLLFDLRNHGKSDKSYTSMGYLERRDVMAAVTYLLDVKKMGKVGLFGVSMGAATGIQAMADDGRIRAGVFEAAYANLADQLAELGRKDFGLPRFPIIPMVMFVYGMRGGFDTGLMNPEDRVASISPRPVFIIHCRDDAYINSSHAGRIFAAAKEPKELWMAPCNEHARAWQSGPALAEKKVVEFFRRHVK